MGVSPWTNPQQQIATSILYICMSKLYPTEINSQISNKPSLQWFPLPTSIYGATCVRSLRFAQTSRDISIQIPGMRLIWPKWAAFNFSKYFAKSVGSELLSTVRGRTTTCPATGRHCQHCQPPTLHHWIPGWWTCHPGPAKSHCWLLANLEGPDDVFHQCLVTAKDHHPSARKEIKVNWFKFNIC